MSEPIRNCAVSEPVPFCRMTLCTDIHYCNKLPPHLERTQPIREKNVKHVWASRVPAVFSDTVTQAASYFYTMCGQIHGKI